jgi:phospholipase/carboxylesterase
MTTDANPHRARGTVVAGRSLSAARLACLLVHGRDQDENVMLDVVQRLALDDVAYLLPVAAGRSWYPGRYFDPRDANQPQLDWAIETCEAALEAACAAGVGDERVVVGGFSQGACVIAELLARRPRPFSGAAVLTGSLLGPPEERAVPGRADGLRIFFAISRYDDWVALEDAQATARAFARAGAAVTFEVHDDRVHRINDRAVAGLRALLTACSRP